LAGKTVYQSILKSINSFFINSFFINSLTSLKLKKFTPLTMISLLCLTVSHITFADYIAGEQANQQGDRETAYKEFYQAAQAKDKRAYGKLGSMYLYGLGTHKDYHQAYIWFHMAYLSGEREGERFRDAASSMLKRENYLKAVAAAELERQKQELGSVPPQHNPALSNTPSKTLN
jgi:TPR repeat protein